jgi:hypothetical protein
VVCERLLSGDNSDNCVSSFTSGVKLLKQLQTQLATQPSGLCARNLTLNESNLPCVNR